MLFLVGLGLGDAKDITVKGLEIVKRAKKVYLEAYTSILTVGKTELVSCYVILFLWTSKKTQQNLQMQIILTKFSDLPVWMTP